MHTIGHTALLCRPEQLVEGAIAISCLPAAAFPPVLILEPAPATADGFRALYQRYTAARRASMSYVVGNSYRKPVKEWSSSDVAAAARETADRLSRHEQFLSSHEQLTETRSWLTRNDRYRRILNSGGCDTAVLLFRPGEHDLKDFFWLDDDGDESPPWVRQRAREYENTELISEDIRRVHIIPRTQSGESDDAHVHYYGDLSELTDACWVAVRPSEEKPKHFIALSSTDPVHVLRCLVQSLETGRPIRAQIQRNTSPDPFYVQGRTSAEEAVLVEASDANSLVGVLYSHHRSADVHVLSAPDTAAIDDALTHYLHCENDERAARRGPAKSDATSFETDSVAARPRGAFLGATQAWSLGDWRGDAIKRIETAVSRAVPEPIVSSIGTRPLTAFTGGIPYQFVRSPLGDWSDKPIGHVVSDPSLVVCSELVSPDPDDVKPAFATIIDPGFFEGHSETDAVLEAMQRHSAYPLVFSRETASSEALVRISGQLPLDLVFFLTHGSDNGILLGDVPISRSQIVQWLRFPSGPVVFNNSCLSWIGVGREFVRIGARGYIGTLWSIDSEHAAGLARVAIVRIVDGTPIAAAIRSTGVPRSTELAYVFIGTVGARIRSGRDPANLGASCVAAADALLDKVYANRDVEHTSLLNRYLYSRAVELLDRPEVASVDEGRLLTVRLNQLRRVSDYGRALGVPAERAGALVEQSFRLAERVNENQDQRSRVQAQLVALQARIQEEYGNASAAADDYLRAIELSIHDEPEKLRLAIARVEALKSAGRWAEVIAAAEHAQGLARKIGDEYALMRITGQLGQLMKRLGQYHAALTHVAEGSAVAARLGNVREQGVFKLDEAQLLSLLGKYRESIRAAEVAGRIARAHELHGLDLAAYGTLARNHLHLGDIAEARTIAKRGLEAAQRKEDKGAQVSFLADLAEVEYAAGNREDAENLCRQCAELIPQTGRFELLPAVLECKMMVIIESADWERITVAVLEHLMALVVLPVAVLRVAAVNAMVQRLRRAVMEIPGNRKGEALAVIHGACAKLLDSDPQARDIRFAQLAALALYRWVEGSPEAVQLAQRLDEISDFDVTWARFFEAAPVT